jgi:hypothetical protein|tara:strand:- start:50 stop:592 length:543 start_codon:yes stop_codon:yes gene_type:complete
VVVLVQDLAILLELVVLVVVDIILVVVEDLLQEVKEMLVALVLHREVRHMDQVEVVELVALALLAPVLRVVMEVLVFNFHQHLEILPQQLDSLDQDQQFTSLLVVEEEFLMVQNQPPDKVVDLADLMLEQDLVHIIPIQELQDSLLKRIVDLEEVVVDHQQHQVEQVDLVSFSSHIPLDK